MVETLGRAPSRACLENMKNSGYKFSLATVRNYAGPLQQRLVASTSNRQPHYRLPSKPNSGSGTPEGY